MGCTVVLAPLPQSKRVPGSTPGWGLYCVFLYSGCLPLSKNMHIRLIGVSKIVLGGECEHVCGCLSRLSLCGPVMDWRSVQGVPRLLPDDRWDRLQPPRDPTNGLSCYRSWTDGWKHKISCKLHNFFCGIQQRFPALFVKYCRFS